MNRDNLNAKQRAALEAIENFLLWYTSDEKTYARMWDAAFDYVEQDHVLISEEVSEVERLREGNKRLRAVLHDLLNTTEPTYDSRHERQAAQDALEEEV